jgi:hypothetical protein
MWSGLEYEFHSQEDIGVRMLKFTNGELKRFTAHDHRTHAERLHRQGTAYKRDGYREDAASLLWNARRHYRHARTLAGTTA